MEEIKVLAFYLPQFHPVPQNDAWWGKGFTEWTNVAKAKPLFKGHLQPLLPADLGFYDLRVPEVREAQARLAEDFNIHGFIYYHYWFGDGEMILETIAERMLELQKPNFPFCFCWANESWSGIWHGLENKILVEQRYFGEKDIVRHFNYLLPFFRDERYIKVEGKPVFFIYEPLNIPDSKAYLDQYRTQAKAVGFPDLFIVCSSKGSDSLDYIELGYDATVSNSFHISFDAERNNYLQASYVQKIVRKFKTLLTRKREPILVDCHKIYANVTYKNTNVETYPMVVPNWDNTPRSKERGVVMLNSSPAHFKKEVKKAVSFLKNQPMPHNKFLIVKSWNEWAEGNILEPDTRHGLQYLQAIKETLLTKD